MNDPIKLAQICAIEAALNTGLAVASKDWPQLAHALAAHTAFEAAMIMHREMGREFMMGKFEAGIASMTKPSMPHPRAIVAYLEGAK